MSAFLKQFFEKIDFEKYLQASEKIMKNYGQDAKN